MPTQSKPLQARSLLAPHLCKARHCLPLPVSPHHHFCLLAYRAASVAPGLPATSWEASAGQQACAHPAAFAPRPLPALFARWARPSWPKQKCLTAFAVSFLDQLLWQRIPTRGCSLSLWHTLRPSSSPAAFGRLCFSLAAAAGTKGERLAQGVWGEGSRGRKAGWGGGGFPGRGRRPQSHAVPGLLLPHRAECRVAKRAYWREEVGQLRHPSCRKCRQAAKGPNFGHVMRGHCNGLQQRRF